MKNVLAGLMLVSMLSGCLTQKARQNAVLPAARATWQHVREDVELGLEGGGLSPAETAAVRVQEVRLDQALEDGSPGALVQVDWTVLEPVAVMGVQLRVANGEISEGVATSLYQRIVNFRDVLRMLTDRVVFLPPGRGVQIVRGPGGPVVAWNGVEPAAILDRSYYEKLPRRRLGLRN